MRIVKLSEYETLDEFISFMGKTETGLFFFPQEKKAYPGMFTYNDIATATELEPEYGANVFKEMQGYGAYVFLYEVLPLSSTG